MLKKATTVEPSPPKGKKLPVKKVKKASAEQQSSVTAEEFAFIEILREELKRPTPDVPAAPFRSPIAFLLEGAQSVPSDNDR